MLCTAGHLTFDVTVRRNSLVLAEQTESEILHQMGGSSAIVAHNAAVSSSIPVRFVGLAGADPLGDIAISQLDRAGVEQRVVRRGRSASVLIIVDEFGERTMSSDLGDAMSLQISDVCARWLEGADLLHLESWYLFDDRTRHVWEHLAQMAKRRGITVTLDVCSAQRVLRLGRHKFLKSLAQIAPDVLICNEEEARALKLANCVPHGIGTAVIHRGAMPTQVIAIILSCESDRRLLRHPRKN